MFFFYCYNMTIQNFTVRCIIIERNTRVRLSGRDRVPAYQPEALGSILMKPSSRFSSAPYNNLKCTVMIDRRLFNFSHRRRFIKSVLKKSGL